ncbi:hypothetical protein [Gaoshiqia sp. Z1-71]|uniref:hypothetical protein n=1 Tax=Gaoshiqia hydrogeniformans TaxID=3290090 RepID=UPI003BF7CC00
MKLILLIILLAFTRFIYAQDVDRPGAHDHHRHHIGLGAGATSIFNENNLVPGIHLHYYYRLTEHSPVSVGLGYESILDDHTHNTLTSLINYEFMEGFSLSAGPGLTFAKEEGKTHTSLSGHLELLYEFRLGEFHLGPMIGLGIDREDSHASVGIHFGFGF